MSVMTNEEITAEFETLFGANQDSEEPETEPTEEDQTTEEETTEEDTEEEVSEDEETEEDQEEDNADDTSDTEPEPSAKDSAASKKSKQNHAFAEQRLRIKEQERFIRSLGKLIGFDDRASIEDIQEKIKDALIEKEAKDNNISVELAKRLDRAEELLQENDRIKLEKKVQEDFSDLIDKHNLDEEAVNEFTTYLLDHGKNPLIDQNVDIESEYLKLHYQDMVTAAVNEALEKEKNRQKKAEEKAASGAPSGGKDKSESKVSTVKELDDLFASMDL